jgi:crossover junction endodeoxyribonuclease RusA
MKPAVVEYQRAVCETAKRHQLKADAGRLTVWVEAWPPNRRKRDLDNLGKFLLDSLHKAGIIEDDALIDDLRFVRMPVVKNGLLRIFIYPFKPIESLESEIAKG